MLLLAAVGWGLYVIYGSKVAQGGGSSVATGMFIAALFATPFRCISLYPYF